VPEIGSLVVIKGVARRLVHIVYGCVGDDDDVCRLVVRCVLEGVASNVQARRNHDGLILAVCDCHVAIVGVPGEKKAVAPFRIF
jgi:hypothetical protein